MRKLFIFSFVLAIFASCSQNEVVEQSKSNYISFTNAFVDNSTRADNTITKDNIKDFTVWGIHEGAELFRNVKYLKSNNGVWQIENQGASKEWELGIYHFHAFTPAGTIQESSMTNFPAGNEFGITTIPFNNTGDVDLCYAYATREQGDEKAGNLTINTAPVGLTFNHILSRAKFTVKNTASKIVKVTNITITSPQSGTIDLSTPGDKATWTWTNVMNPIAYSFGETQDVAVQNITSANNVLFLIPNKVTDMTIKFNIDVAGQTIEKVIKMDHEFKLGYSYNFIATITDADIDNSSKLIEFTVDEVVGWAGESGVGFTDVDVKNK